MTSSPDRRIRAWHGEFRQVDSVRDFDLPGAAVEDSEEHMGGLVVVGFPAVVDHRVAVQRDGAGRHPQGVELRFFGLIDSRELELDRVVAEHVAGEADLRAMLIAGDEEHALGPSFTDQREEPVAGSRASIPGFRARFLREKDLRAGHDQSQVRGLSEAIAEPGPLIFTQHVGVGTRFSAVPPVVEHDHPESFP